MPETDVEVFRGRCLCEAVAFELQPSPQYGQGRAMGVCHCPGCQRWTGGSNLPFVVAVPERFHVTQGQELLAHYRDQSSTIRAFCRRCGSGLYQDVGIACYVCAGAIDRLRLQPAFHLHIEDMAPWELRTRPEGGFENIAVADEPGG